MIARTHLLALALLAPLALVAPQVARAQDAGDVPAGRGMGMRGMGRHHRGPLLREEVERRIRTMRAVALANRLQLDEATALRMNAVMNGFDQRRDALRDRMHTAMQTLQTESRSAQPDTARIDGAVQTVIEVQSAMADLRRQELEALMKDLDPKRRAQLVIFFREFPNEIRRMMHRGRMMGGDEPPPPDPDE